MKNIDFESWIKTMQDRGYEIYQNTTCLDCGFRAISMHSSSVVHAKCSNCDWKQTGFGGPNVHSWGEAVRRTHDAEGVRFVEQEKRAERY